MTARARRVLAMRLEPFAHRRQLAALAAFLQRRHVGRRRRRRRAEDRLEQPLAAQHRRRAVGIRRHGQQAALAEQSAAPAVGQRHAPEAVAVDVRNPVVPGQALVHEGVVRAQELDDAAILLQLALEEERRFLQERVAKVLVEIGEEIGIRRDVADVLQHQPLPGEVLDERLRARIGEHAPDLLLQHRSILQLAALRGRQQLIIGNAAPEKERQPARQFDVGQAVQTVRRQRPRDPVRSGTESRG